MSLKKASRTKSLSLSGDDFPLRPTGGTGGSATGKPKATFATAKRPEDTLKIMKYIDDNVIGKGVAFLGPYGRRKVVYADYASSGRSLQFLEDYINKEVLPAFGDISCISAVTGLQSHLYDNEARDLVRAAVGANGEDEIVFCDNPTERLCYLLSNPNVCDLSQPQFHNYSHSANSNTSFGGASLHLGVANRHNSFTNTSALSDSVDMSTLQGLSAPPVLFVSTSEPVSNLRSWIDAGWQIERIVKNHEGFLDLVDLEKRLQHYSENRRKMVGLFSGASRLTGILADDVATTILLHQYDALSIWDHSMAASCAPISTNPVLPGAQKDAIFFHCNRLVGGVQAPGVLVIKRRLIEHSTSFLTDSVGVVSAVRAGLVLQLKESLGSQAIMGRMEKTCKQMLAHVRTIPEIVLLGPPCTTAKRLTTLCFMVRHPRGAFLHHRFVVAVLNDVFGIQATADNMISDSLGINPQLAVEYEKLLNDESLQAGCLHPGYTRITFPFFMPEAEVAFILEALKMVATEAWKLLPQYEVNERSGEWRHHSNSLAKERKWLGAIRYIDGKMLFSDRRISGPGSFPQNYSDCLQTARNLFNRARKMAQRSTTEQIVLKLTNAAMEKLRWYMLSGEAHELLLGHSHNVKNTVPFDPTRIPENSSLMLIHRHHSLSALDIKRFKSRSLPASPLQISTRRQNSSSPSPYQSHSPTPTSSPPMVRFSVGGEVTTMLNPSPMANAGTGTATATSVVTAGSPTIRRDMNVSRNSSCSESTEDIQAYVKEVTKELATEIKSEIREVISKVEDVLESTDSIEMNSIVNFSSLGQLSHPPVENKRDSISTSDVVDYLREFSREMTNEVKSEIRDVVNAVDEIISPEGGFLGARKNSPPDILRNGANGPTTAHGGGTGGHKLLIKQRYSDITPDATTHRPRSADNNENKHRSESFPRPSSAASPEHMALGPPLHYATTVGAILKSADLRSTMSSQDSGINMSFCDVSDEHSRLRTVRAPVSDRIRTVSAEVDSCNKPSLPPRRLISEPTGESITEASPVTDATQGDAGVGGKCALTRQQHVLNRSPSGETGPAVVQAVDGAVPIQWHQMPKEVWKQAAETLDEYNMLKDGDRVLVCLSGSSSSLCLLHLLHQFCRTRQLAVQLAAITIDGGDGGVDPRALMLYLKDLGVNFFYEPLASDEQLQHQLVRHARHRQYNVLAMASTLDQLADRFLASLLYRGELSALQAVQGASESKDTTIGDVRIVRPLLYLREHLFDEFALIKGFPSRASALGQDATYPNGTAELLRGQEKVNPQVYNNIRNALKPILSLRIEPSKSAYEMLRSSLNTRE
uniref:Aminotransferase class V domain-containing protein n=1 Tax=Anopheles atroparvus TaxID=41427 RepID=A0AAG5CP81_ANOAO